MPEDIKECSLYSFTLKGRKIKTTPKDITARAAAQAAQTTADSKQDALTATQLAAVNSGVTAVKVAAWDAIEVPTKTSDLTNDSGFITAAAIPAVPTKTSDLTNDSGFMTSYTETDPTVPAWAKAASKPTYTASEVGALPDTTVIPAASSASPQMDGTAAAGSSADYARADHIHPSDSSKQDALSSAQMDAVNSGITAAKITEYDSIVTMFGVPEIIRSGDDLNDFTTPGHYSATSGTIASALVNCPTTINFSLFVFYRTITLISQMIITSSTTIFIRHRNSSGWTVWYKFTGTQSGG